MSNLCWCYGPEGARLRMEEHRAIARGDAVIPYAPAPGACPDCTGERVVALARIETSWVRQLWNRITRVWWFFRRRRIVRNVRGRVLEDRLRRAVTDGIAKHDGVHGGNLPNVHVHIFGEPCDFCEDGYPMTLHRLGHEPEVRYKKPAPTTMPGPGERVSK